jgi:hypothetical protein
MFARIIYVAVLGFLALVPGSVIAQEPDAEMQEMRQQLRDIGMQVMQKMAEKGIDPQQFFGDIRQQMQDGSLDMAALQQKLVDSDLIDKDTVTQMQTKAQSATLNSIKRQLEVNDAEWAALLPKIQRVIIASADGESSNQLRGLIAGFTGGQLPKSDVSKRRQELQAALAIPATTPGEIQTKLRALREARQKAKEELGAAQKDLIELLTVRQETALVLLGLL